MTTDNELDRTIRTWIASEAAPKASPELARAVADATQDRRQSPRWFASLGQAAPGRSARLAVAVAAVILIVVGGLVLGPRFQPAGGPPASSSAGPPAGFMEVVFKVLPAEGRAPDQAGIAATIAVMTARARLAGLVGVTVSASGQSNIAVTLPVTDADEIPWLGTTGLVQFIPLPPATYGTASTNSGGPTGVTENQPLPADPGLVPLFDGSAVTSAVAAIDQNGQPVVDFDLSSDAANKFGDYTTNNVGNFFAIVLDGTVISAPSINSAIGGGRGEITVGTGTDAQAEVNSLAEILTSGALPFPVSEILSSTASPEPTSP